MKLEKISYMERVDSLFCFFIVYDALSYIFIENSVGKTELVLVAFAAKTVGRNFFNVSFGDSEIFSYSSLPQR